MNLYVEQTFAKIEYVKERKQLHEFLDSFLDKFGKDEIIEMTVKRSNKEVSK